MPKIPQLLLAAGSSSRMGQPKALLPWENQTLLESRIDVLKNTHQSIVLVLGSHAELIQETIPIGSSSKVVINSEWSQGMGSSIVKGVAELLKTYPEAEGILISLLDQPLIPLAHYESMLQQHEKTPEKIVVSESDNGWLGVPVLFPSSFFQELLNLQGHESGKTLIKRHPRQCISVGGAEYLEDMDTPEAYERLQKKSRANS